ncbi:MAG: hypothetical protein FWB93_06450 [Oscillospiraceae bacterium]|nr:hypothetical protein [Oscillospiraceae bacterium]
MPLTPAICTQCNSAIQVDSDKEAGVCSSCGTAFVVEKAINNYIVNGQDFDALLTNANVFLDLKDFEKAQNIFDDITTRYPSKAIGWWGLLQCLTLNFTECDSDNQASAALYYERTIKFATDEESVQFAETFENFLSLQSEQEKAFAAAEQAKINATNNIIFNINVLEKQRMEKRLAYSKKLLSPILPIILSIIFALIIHYVILVVGVFFLVFYIHQKSAKKRLYTQIMQLDTEIYSLKKQQENL